MIGQKTIETGLSQVGLLSGSIVLVHSSLSAFGWVEGGADGVIDALLAMVGESGTVLVPTLTGDEALSSENPPTFNPVHTPCWTGIIPEMFRTRPDAVRSLHPTHSVAAIGAEAEILTKDHAESITPCDALSPYGKLAQRDNAVILLLGVDHDSDTMLHHVEEIVGVDYHIQKGLANCTIIANGGEYNRHYLLHQYGTLRNFMIIDQLLTERGFQRQVQIGNATVRLVQARRMVAMVGQCLRADGRFLCQ